MARLSSSTPLVGCCRSFELNHWRLTQPWGPAYKLITRHLPERRRLSVVESGQRVRRRLEAAGNALRPLQAASSIDLPALLG